MIEQTTITKIDKELEKLIKLIEASSKNVDKKSQNLEYLKKIRENYTKNEEYFNRLDEVKRTVSVTLTRSDFVRRHIAGDKKLVEQYLKIMENLSNLLTEH